MARRTTLALIVLLLAGVRAVAAADMPAKDLFGKVAGPTADTRARVIGSYAKGCFAGGVALPSDGPAWEAMRLSRNRLWGHPDLIAFIERLALEAQADGWPGLLIGDIAQPRGGPMRTGHASHQIGLDVDIWLTPKPAQRLSDAERETLPATSMLKPGTRSVDPARFTDAHIALIRRAALDSQVERIFVHPGIKQFLCAQNGTDRTWLAKLRPWWGHDDHFHVRLTCPAHETSCRPQEPPPPGDGCGDDLAWWLTDEPWKPKPQGPPAKPLMLADLPSECADVLHAQ